jgi:hypothetical protein
VSSGKLVIIGILTVAIVSAVGGWWFRYANTHGAAMFLGPSAARLIRDAPHVELIALSTARPNFANANRDIDLLFPPSDRIDISAARGLTHLRNALLEDRSYSWPAESARADAAWKWAMIFSDEDESAVLLFAPGWEAMATLERPERILSCEPIAAGLASMLGQLAAEAPQQAR